MFEQRSNSKGNQSKYLEDGYWFKEDFLGYEALSEYVVSSLLRKSTVTDYVEYSIRFADSKRRRVVECRSKNFLLEGEKEITLPKLFQIYLGIDLYLEIENPMLSTEDCFKYIVDNMESITGLKDIGKYITGIIELDAFFLNEDRHLSNISVLYNERYNQFRLAPIYDFGGSLFSDTSISYDLDLSVVDCLSKIKAKPVSPDFVEQVDACRSLWGSQVKFYFTKSGIDKVLYEAAKFYNDSVIDRVNKTLYLQMDKHSDMFIKDFMGFIDSV